MSRDEAILSAYERLVEGLAADLLDAADTEVLASHDTPAAARVAADTLRRRLQRDASGDAAAARPAPDVPLGPSNGDRRRPGKEP